MPGAMWPHMLWPPEVPRQQKSGLRAEDGGRSPYSSLYRTLPATWFSSLSSESLSSISKTQSHPQIPDTRCLCGFSKASAEGH